MKIESMEIISKAIDEYIYPWAWCMECTEFHTTPECLLHVHYGDEEDYADDCDCEECRSTSVLSKEYLFDMWCEYTTKWGEIFHLEAA